MQFCETTQPVKVVLLTASGHELSLSNLRWKLAELDYCLLHCLVKGYEALDQGPLLAMDWIWNDLATRVSGYNTSETGRSRSSRPSSLF